MYLGKLKKFEIMVSTKTNSNYKKKTTRAPPWRIGLTALSKFFVVMLFVAKLGKEKKIP